MPSFWDDAIESPAFNLGIGLLAGAPTATPWQAAAQQLNQYQALRQNREYQKLQAKLYEAQARKAEREAQLQTQTDAQWQAAIQAEPDEARRQLMKTIGPEAWAKGLANQYFEGEKRTVVGPNATLLKGDTPIYTAPPAPLPPMDIERLLALENDPRTPPAARQVFSQLRQKMITHAPAPTAISYGSPVFAKDAQGNDVVIQGSNRGGAPNIIPGLSPAPPPPTPPKPQPMPAELQRMEVASRRTLMALDAYDKMLKDYSPADLTDPNKRAAWESITAELQLTSKEANALGVLAGPDMGLMEDLIGAPLSFKGALYGKNALQTKAKAARDAVNRGSKVLSEMYPGALGATPPAAPASKTSPKRRVRVDAEGNILP